MQIRATGLTEGGGEVGLWKSPASQRWGKLQMRGFLFFLFKVSFFFFVFETPAPVASARMMSLSQLGSLYLQSPWLKREACYKLCLQGPPLSLPHLKVAGQGSLQGVNVERWPATGKALSRDSGLGKIRGSPQNKGRNSGSLGWESLVCRN